MKKEDKTIAMHYGPNASIKLIKLKNNSFMVQSKTNHETKNNFFTKEEEKHAKELYETLININY